MRERITEMQMIIEGQSHFQPFGLLYWGFTDLNKGVGSMTAFYDHRRRLSQILRPSPAQDRSGKTLRSGRVKNDRQSHAVVEATHSWMVMYNWLDDICDDVHATLIWNRVRELPYGPATDERSRERPDRCQHPTSRLMPPKTILAPPGRPQMENGSEPKGSKAICPAKARDWVDRRQCPSERNGTQGKAGRWRCFSPCVLSLEKDHDTLESLL